MNKDELYDGNCKMGYLSKIPSQNKFNKSQENIKNLDKCVYVLQDGLKICHINSTFIKNNDLKQKVSTFEYLISDNINFLVLSYNYKHGLSILRM